ncbi:hypothetical protein JKF63_04346 [Porcisia hertigi]|uniref:Sister chromatid cohesion protein DCC1 n=1 Tax=Porcisia hertigi TaxID=2761500 RepID=A0A836II68_9TRYP|nr:hypothetical protein JKF63_04346 [Porcisia hertigi]
MDRIYVRSDFASRHEYRLVSVDEVWVQRFEEEVYPTYSTDVSAVRRKRRRVSQPSRSPTRKAEVSVALIMKGDEQLCLHDAQSTRSVNRIEYSNTMLLAARRLNRAGRSATHESPGSCDDARGAVCASSPTDASHLDASRVRQYANSVVVGSLNRMFDTNTTHPQRNVSAILGESYLTIEELEGTDGSSSGEKPPGPSRRGYTFAQLARIFRSSPAELAAVLQSIGAVVHRGFVRLLHPSLVYESLAASLTFLDAAEPCDVSWHAVRKHLCPSVYPDVVLRSLEAVYGGPSDPNEAGEENDAVTLQGMPSLLNLPRVLVALAGGVFDAHQGVIRRTLSTGEVALGLPLDTFVRVWVDAIPSSFYGVADIPPRSSEGAQKALMEKLRGYVVIEPRSGGVVDGNVQGTAWWLPKDTLSNDFATRLRTLFELRPQRWDQVDLKEYLRLLVPPEQSFEHVILRYTREYRIPKQPVQYALLT